MSFHRSIVLALALSMGAALSLGITRFSYGLLLLPMRTDLDWSYTLAGAMNTFNALGYLLGAMLAPRLIRRFGPGRLLLGGAALAVVFMGATGFFASTPVLLAQRLLAGLASAWVFVAGGLLAAHLGLRQRTHGALLLGIYYGGTGVGIALAAWLVPAMLHAAAGVPHGWSWAWWALAVAGAVASAILAWAVREIAQQPPADGAVPRDGRPDGPVSPARYGWALAGYGCFGAGYIGYMTFIVALLRQHGIGEWQTTLFYSLLGIACVVSPWVWSRLLAGYRGGQPQALLNGLLGVATLLPVLADSLAVALVSGVLFGGVFLSVVASTTAFVKHNLPQAGWASGIGAFTIVFAAGQIVGPVLAGVLADGPGGLGRGLLVSALVLWTGAALASRQRALA